MKRQLMIVVEDVILWVVLAMFCVALLIDYVAGTEISEWLI